jgi:fimbrial isopeptide formation D2 family protein
MKQLIKIGGILSSLILFSALSHGAGTSAGSWIQNQASVSYQTASGTITDDSAIVQFQIQELVRSTIVKLDAGSISVSSPQTNAAMKFRLQNDGNSPEGFNIFVSQDSGDDFDVTVGSFYMDDGDGIFDPALDTLYDNSNPPELAPDSSLVLWVTSTIPSSLSDADLANLNVSAVSHTFVADGQPTPSAGDVVNNAGPSGTDVVNAASITSVTSTYVVTDIDVTITKSISATRDNLGGGSGNQAIPGAEVDYTLTVTVTGTGTANNVTVTDDLPDQLKLKNGVSGTITVGGVDETASSADADGTSYDANTDTITVELGNISAGDPSIDIEFTTIIQ